MKILLYILPILLLSGLCISIWFLNKQNTRLKQDLGYAQAALSGEQQDKELALVRIADLEDEKLNLSEHIKSLLEDNDLALTMVAKVEGQLLIEKKKSKNSGKIIFQDRVVSEELPPVTTYLEDCRGGFCVPGPEFIFDDSRLHFEANLFTKEAGYKLTMAWAATLFETLDEDGKPQYMFEIVEKVPAGEEPAIFHLKGFDVLIDKSRFTEKFFWFSPHLDLALVLAIPAAIYPGLGFSFMGYGLTKDDLSWRFARLGLGISDNRILLSVTPVLFNLGKTLPLISNLWVGVGGIVGLDLEGDWTLGSVLNLSVVF